MIASRTQQRYKISVTKSLRNLFFHGVKKLVRSFLFTSPEEYTRNYRVRRLSAIDSDIRCLHRDQIDNLWRSEPVDIKEKEGEGGKKREYRAMGFINLEYDELTRGSRLSARSTLIIDSLFLFITLETYAYIFI